MRKVLGVLAVLIVLLAIVGIVKKEELTRLMAVQTLFDEDKIVDNFTHMDQLFHSTPMETGTTPSPLPEGPRATLPASTDDWIRGRALTSIVVLSDGELVYEDYFLGTDRDDLRLSWSVAKSFLSALLGIVIDEGAIASLDDPVTTYAPALAGSAYDGATIRNVANMASGVWFDEDYMAFSSDINKMGRVLALGGSLDRFTAGLDEPYADPGTKWLYVSMDTHVLGMVIRGATGRRIPELMEEKIIRPLGLERAPYYLTDAHDNAFVLGGLNLTTRDYARFGQMILQNGEWQGQQIVPAEWVAASTMASAPTAPGEFNYGLQWWLPIDPAPGEVFAIGVYGQYIWIDRTAGVVIAINSANRDFTDEGVMEDNIEMMRKITKAVAR